MHLRSKLLIAGTVVAVLFCLTAADALIREHELTARLWLTTDDTEPATDTQVATETPETPTVAETVAVSTGNAKPRIEEVPSKGVAKHAGADIRPVLVQNGFTFDASQESTMLAQVLPSDADVSTLALLKDGDRAGFVAWVDSGQVKAYFIALKDALLTSFSTNLKDLRDETLVEAEQPVRNVLTFIDPSLSDERVVFVRVRERLMEFHIAPGSEDAMFGLIDALSVL